MGIQKLESKMLDETATSMLGSRNIIHNGAMLIDQRGTGANTVGQGTSGLYSVDRWGCQDNSASSDFLLAQDTDVPAGKGFIKSLKFTVYSANSSPTYSSFFQGIEGLNILRLAWGTAGAKNVTLSFWVKCSVLGNYSVCLRAYNGSTLRSYPTTFTINTVDTWEYKTITVPGDTVMVPSTDNTLALNVFFTPGITSASAYAGTPNQWSTANYHGASTGSNLMATQGATMRVTGVQLEEGSVATPFEHRPYSVELAICQRYLYKHWFANQMVLYCESAAGMFHTFKYPVTMRATPATVIPTISWGDTRGPAGSGTKTITSVSTESTTTELTSLRFVASGWSITAGYCCHVDVVGNYMLVSSEL